MGRQTGVEGTLPRDYEKIRTIRIMVKENVLNWVIMGKMGEEGCGGNTIMGAQVIEKGEGCKEGERAGESGRERERGRERENTRDGERERYEIHI